MDTQLVELAGRHRLISELVLDGLEVAVPLRDRGVDLIAYADLSEKAATFVARPIQLKASSQGGFGIERKYEKICNLILAFVWNLGDGESEHATYALTYAEAIQLADQKGWTKTASWQEKGKYVNTAPGKELCKMLEPFKMTKGAWWAKVCGK